MLATLVSLAAAADIITAVGDVVQLNVPGTWPRGAPTDGGWHVLNSDQSDYHYQFVSDSLIVDDDSRRRLTDNAHLLDHSIGACPDGTYMHVASSSSSQKIALDDTLYGYRYDEDFNMIAQGTLQDAGEAQSALDPSSVCGEWIKAGAVHILNSEPQLELILMNDNGEASGTFELDKAPEPVGGAMYADDDYLWVVGSPSADKHFIRVSQYDKDFELVEMREIDIAPEGYLAYWTQGLTKVGKTWFIAHMVQTEDDSWDRQRGNVWISLFNEDWELIEQEIVTNYAPPYAAFHPWIAVKGDQALVLYTYDEENWGLLLDLNLDAAGVEPDPDDTGGDDSGDGGEPDDSAAQDDDGKPGVYTPATTGGCGCNAAPVSLGWVLAVGALLRYRRR